MACFYIINDCILDMYVFNKGKKMKQKIVRFNQAISFVTAVLFMWNMIVFPSISYGKSQEWQNLNFPEIGTRIHATGTHRLPLIKGLVFHPEDAMKFDFIIDSGDKPLNADDLEKESTRQVKYFLSALATPQENIWVNLSPYESDRIIENNFGRTVMGRDLLAQDYILKQLTASLTYPEESLGQEFWERIYAKVQQEYNTMDIPIDTFNKVWIVPESVNVVEYENSAFVSGMRLKVLLEEDYYCLAKGQNCGLSESEVLGLQNEVVGNNKMGTSKLASEIVRDLLIPAIEKEVNEGAHFSALRQIVHATILASWFKVKLKSSLLGQVYTDKNKTKGVESDDQAVTEKIYQQYLAAFEKGVYEYIREDFDVHTDEIIPKKYFSGGFSLAKLPELMLEGLMVMPSGVAESEARWDFLAQMQPLGQIVNLHKTTFAFADIGPAYVPAVNLNALDWGVDQEKKEQPTVSSPLDEDRSYGGEMTRAEFDKKMQDYRSLQVEDESLIVPVGSNSDDVVYQEVFGSIDPVLSFFKSERFKLVEALSKGNKKDDIEKIENMKIKVFIIENTKFSDSNYHQTSFGAMRDKEGDYYFERSYLDHVLNDLKNPFGMIKRIMIHLGTESDLSGKLWAQYRWAETQDKYKKDMRNLLNKPGLVVEDIVSAIRQNLIPFNDPSSLENDDILGKYEIIPPTEKTKDFARKLDKIAQKALYMITVSSMDKDIDLMKRYMFRLSENDPFPDNDSSMKIAQFSGKYDPISAAHALVVALMGMAVLKVDMLNLDVTKGDYRKPGAFNVYAFRQQLLEEIIQVVFQGLLSVPIPIEGDKGLNGEEKQKYYLALNESIGKLVYYYLAGGDHEFSFVRDKGEVDVKALKKIVGEERMVDLLSYLNDGWMTGKVIDFDSQTFNFNKTDINMPGLNLEEKEAIFDVLFLASIRKGRIIFESIVEGNYDFVESARYVELLKLLKKVESDILTKDQNSVIEALIKHVPHSRSMNMLKSKVSAELGISVAKVTMPKLDTFGKVFLNQGDVPENVQLKVMITSRGEKPIDKLRDYLNIPTAHNQGMEEDISSTILRTGLMKVALTKKIDTNDFGAAFKFTLRKLLVPENRSYAHYLIRVGGETILPQAIELLWPSETISKSEKGRQEILRVELDNKLVQKFVKVQKTELENSILTHDTAALTLTINDQQGKSRIFRVLYAMKHEEVEGGELIIKKFTWPQGEEDMDIINDVYADMVTYLVALNKADMSANYINWDEYVNWNYDNKKNSLLSSSSALGGIDLTSFDAQIRRDIHGVPLALENQSALNMINLEGIVPFYISGEETTWGQLLGLTAEFNLGVSLP